MKLALVRARTPSWDERLVGDALVPLGPEGFAAARAAAARIAAKGETARVYGPGQGHAAEAAAALAAALPGSLLAPRPELTEVHFGLWQGLSESELLRRHKTSFRAFLTDARAVVAPEGEEIAAAFARLEAFVGWLRRKHAREARQVVVVAPEFAFVLLEAAWLEREAPPGLWRQRAAGEDVRFLG